MGAKIFIIVTIYKGYKPIQTLKYFFKKNIPKDTKDLKILHVYGVLLASINLIVIIWTIPKQPWSIAHNRLGNKINFIYWIKVP